MNMHDQIIIIIVCERKFHYFGTLVGEKFSFTDAPSIGDCCSFNDGKCWIFPIYKLDRCIR